LSSVSSFAQPAELVEREGRSARIFVAYAPLAGGRWTPSVVCSKPRKPRGGPKIVAQRDGGPCTRYVVVGRRRGRPWATSTFVTERERGRHPMLGVVLASWWTTVPSRTDPYVNVGSSRRARLSTFVRRRYGSAFRPPRWSLEGAVATKGLAPPAISVAVRVGHVGGDLPRVVAAAGGGKIFRRV